LIGLGTLVRLKSGGPVMTVTSGCQHPLNGVNCMYYDVNHKVVQVVENVSTLALDDLTPAPEPTPDTKPEEKTK
jgi:uncharacterized protein YodC (DUF2158 family)